MLDITKIVALQNRNINDWHQSRVIPIEEIPLKFIEENNHWNYQLWHEEDIARIKDIEPSRIMEAKRNIDNYNQHRNNAMEKIDEWILNYLIANKTPTTEKLHSETPGMMIDRLSIMALKKYHMLEEAVRESATEEHRLRCSEKVMILEEQINDLSNCLTGVIDKLLNGELKFKVYRQLKMYNNPDLNPQLYNRTESK
jgi:hypothetical protein